MVKTHNECVPAAPGKIDHLDLRVQNFENDFFASRNFALKENFANDSYDVYHSCPENSKLKTVQVI